MSTDLIARLRVCGESLAPSPMHTACRDAADALEAQAAEIARLRACVFHESQCVEAAKEEITRLRAEVDAQPVAPEPSWCAANGSQPCRIGPHGPKGALQCEWCGDSPALAAQAHGQTP